MKKKTKDKSGHSAPSLSTQEMLTTALVLALTAPNDAAMDRAVALAETIAKQCSEFEVFAAKRDSLKRVNMLGDTHGI